MPRPVDRAPGTRRRTAAALALGAALVLSACGGSPSGAAEQGSDTDLTQRANGTPSYAVDAPGPLKGRLLTADVLITGADTLPDDLVARIRKVKGVAAALPISVANASVDGRTLTVAAVDPAQFRRFTPVTTAQADFVWDRLAGGEVAVDLKVSKKLISRGDLITLGTATDAPTVHVGSYAPLVRRIHALVNTKRGEQLGIPEHNALIVSTGEFTPSALTRQFTRILGDRATLQTLALEFDLDAVQTAVLTGGSVSEAVGHFTYTNRANGEISPDQAWVREYIRTEEVPILGRVTCNKAYLPQLRAALSEVVQRGLADKINPGEYAGCYYPRYIGRDPANGLSLHSWGIAVDLNVPGNLRGTRGEIDREVVRIFKKWGMAWGGDWNYTDPMHFEMNAVVKVG